MQDLKKEKKERKEKRRISINHDLSIGHPAWQRRGQACLRRGTALAAFTRTLSQNSLITPQYAMSAPGSENSPR